MIDQVSDKRHPGWPLDSISLNRNTLIYFVEEGNNKYDTTEQNIMLGEYRKRLIDFCSAAEAFGVSIIELQIDNGHTTGHYNVIITAKNPSKKTVDGILNYLKELEGVKDIKYIF